MRRINRILRAQRALHGLTQGDLAGRIDRSQTWLCQLERGLIEPSDLDVALICRILKAHPESLFPNSRDGALKEQTLDEGGKATSQQDSR